MAAETLADRQVGLQLDEGALKAAMDDWLTRPRPAPALDSTLRGAAQSIDGIATAGEATAQPQRVAGSASVAATSGVGDGGGWQPLAALSQPPASAAGLFERSLRRLLAGRQAAWEATLHRNLQVADPRQPAGAVSEATTRRRDRKRRRDSGIGSDASFSLDGGSQHPAQHTRVP